LDKLKLDSISNLETGNEVLFNGTSSFVRVLNSSDVELYSTKNEALDLNNSSGKLSFDSKELKNTELFLYRTEKRVVQQFVTDYTFTKEFNLQLKRLNVLLNKTHNDELLYPHNEESSIISFKTKLNRLYNRFNNQDFDSSLSKLNDRLDVLQNLYKPSNVYLNTLA
jgi:hypothetical protein